MINIKGIVLHPGQLKIKDQIFNSSTKFHIINASRQSGKTTLLHQLALYYAINTSNIKILYVAPVYSITKNIFNEIIEGLLGSGAIQEYYKADQSIKFINGSEIVFKSASNYDNIRGGSYEYCFVDEFAYVADDAWLKAIRPTLAVKGIKCFIASTPKGRNLFYQLAQLGMGENEHYQYHYMNYKDNPYYDLQEVKDAKITLPESIFRQEYEAEFVDDGGVVFENLRELAIIQEFIKQRVSGDRYYAGPDLARQTDYTVLTIMNQRKEVVFVYRANKTSWDLIVKNILKWCILFQPVLYVEVNSIGDVIYENIKKFYKRVYPFVTSNTSKQELIEDLIYEFGDGNIYIPTIELFPEMYQELGVFTFEYSKKTRSIKNQSSIREN